MVVRRARWPRTGDVSHAAMFAPCCSRHAGGLHGICGVSPSTKSRDAFGSASRVFDSPATHACSRDAPCSAWPDESRQLVAAVVGDDDQVGPRSASHASACFRQARHDFSAPSVRALLERHRHRRAAGLGVSDRMRQCSALPIAISAGSHCAACESPNSATVRFPLVSP